MCRRLFHAITLKSSHNAAYTHKNMSLSQACLFGTAQGCSQALCAYVHKLTVLCSQIPVYAYGWHHHLAVSVRHSRVVPFSRTTHMPGCSVHWPEWQLRVLGWAAGIVPFMVMADGANRDERLLQGTGGGMKEAEISQGFRTNTSKRKSGERVWLKGRRQIEGRGQQGEEKQEARNWMPTCKQRLKANEQKGILKMPIKNDLLELCLMKFM